MIKKLCIKKDCKELTGHKHFDEKLINPEFPSKESEKIIKFLKDTFTYVHHPDDKL